jgi:flagellar protein FliS
MMYSRHAAKQYQNVTNHGLVASASPTRLVQIMFEHILSNLATAQGCMERIHNNLPYNDVVIKCKSMSRAIRLIGQLDATLDMEKGGKIAENLHNLYAYMLTQLTLANAHNDTKILTECVRIVRTIKVGWDGIVKDNR